MKKKRGSALTLLEVMLAFFLLAILLSLLFGFYQQNARSSLALSKAKEELLIKQRIHQRLLQLFNALSPSASQEEKKSSPSFYTAAFEESSSDALFFYFDNGIDPNPAFCDRLFCALYLSRKQQLCLAIWSKEGEGRQELLLEGVHSLSFLFFDPEEDAWSSSWTPSDSALPPLIKITLKNASSKVPPLEFSYILGNAKEGITYSQKGSLP